MRRGELRVLSHSEIVYVLISIPPHRTQINLARLAEQRAAVVRVDGADAAPGRLGVVVVGLRLEERVHALDRFRAQRREEARHVLLVFFFLAG